MKKINIRLLLTGLIISGLLLFSACHNLLSPSVSTGGQGNVTVSLAAGPSGRTLMPSALDFDFYEFTFTNGAYEETFEKAKSPGGSFSFSVPVGSGYSLNVKAYKDTGDGLILAAEGNSAPFTVSSSTSVTVKLTGNLSGGEIGTFLYNIQYPAGAQIIRFVLIGKNDEIDLLDGAVEDGSAMTNELSVAAGWYGLELDIIDGNKIAYDDDIVVIYSDTTTFYGRDDAPVLFEAKDFKTASGNNGVPVPEWHGFNIAGENHYNNDYDTSQAAGTWYEKFTDSKGETWNDVIKLEPPMGSYANDTIAMTYPLYEAGTYSLEMYIWVEPSGELVSLQWYNTGNWSQAIIHNSINPNNSGDVKREGWIHVNGEIWVGGYDDEFGLLARSDDGRNGLKDAVIYIRDLQLKLDGEEIINTNTELRISPENSSVWVNKTRQLSANQDVTWGTNAPGIAVVDTEGLVTGITVGTATITAASVSDPSKTAQVSIEVIDKPNKMIAMTFDDGPEPVWTPLFADVLRGKATVSFMVNGRKSELYPEILQAMDREGHEIANHTYDHIFEAPNALRLLSIDDIRIDLIKTNIAIENAIGKPPKHFRAPALLYGKYASGEDPLEEEIQYDANLPKAAGSMGMALIDASYHQTGNFDWDGAYGPEKIFQRIREVARPDGILLMHDMAGNSHNTLAALPDIVDWLIDQGYEILSVADMEKKKNIASLEPGIIYYDFVKNMPAPEQELVQVTGIRIFEDGIEVSGDEIEFAGMGDTRTFTASTLPVNASLKQVYWYSDNSNVASVDANGVVTARGPGKAVIRAVTGFCSAHVNVVSKMGVVTKTDWNCFVIEGTDGEGFQPSNALHEVQNDFSPGDGYSYSNVLELAPPQGGYPFDKEDGGGVAMSYVIPYTGTYTLSVDMWVDSNSPEIDLIWYNCDGWDEIIGNTDWNSSAGSGVRNKIWLHGTGSGLGVIEAGSTLCFLACGYLGTTGLQDATVYIKNLKLELDGVDDPVIEINSTATYNGIITPDPVNIGEPAGDTWRGFNIAGKSSYYDNDRSSPGFDAVNCDELYDMSRAIGTVYESFTDLNHETWNDVLELKPPAEKNPLDYLYYEPMNGYEKWTMAMTHPLNNAGTYTLDMYIWVEPSVEPVSLQWYNTADWTQMILYNDNSDVQRGTWLHVYGDISVDDIYGNEIGLLARSGDGAVNENGLKDAVIYIRDLQLSFNGIGTPEDGNTIDKWEDTDAFKLAGINGIDGKNDPYYASGAVPEVGDYQGYGNVLKLSPAGDDYYHDDYGGSLVLTYTAQESGTYSWSMEVFVDSTAEDVNLVLYECNTWYEFKPADDPSFNGNEVYVQTGVWITIEKRTQYVAEGVPMGLLARGFNEEDPAGPGKGLQGATIYVRDFKLELAGETEPVIDIPGTTVP